MALLQRIKAAVDGFRQKQFDDEEDLSGGFEIFRQFSGFESGWSKTKQMRTYEKSLYVFRCVKKIAEKTASIDFNLFRIKNVDGDKEEVFVHEALDLLYRPNPFQTKTEFFEKYMINKLLTGQSFVLKVRENGPGSRVRELWNLRPDLMTIVKDRQLFIKAFEFNKEDGKVVFAPEDVIYDATASPLDEWGGLSVIKPAQVRIETEEYSTQYQRYFFKNNARPDFILTSEGKISTKQKDEIKERWDKRHKGALNAGKGAFLERGLKYQQVSISQKDMDYIEGMRFTRDEILLAFAVPKPIVAITDDVNFANAKTAMEIFLEETVQPEINRITEKMNEHLIYPEFGDNYFIHYDEDFLPRNEKEEAEINNIHLESGSKLINEVREDMGLEPVVGGWSLYKPVGVVAVGGLPQNGNKNRKLTARERMQKRIFKGRGKAYKFLEVKREVEKAMYDALAREIKEEAQNGYKRAIVPKEHRNAYADVINKQIDEKGKSFQPKIEDFMEGQKKRFIEALEEKYDKGLKWYSDGPEKALGGLFDKRKENSLFAEVSIPFISEFLESAGRDAMQTVNPAEQFEVTDRIARYIKERARKLAQGVNATTIDKLSRTLSEGIDGGEGIAQLRERVEGVYSEFSVWRAETIARTEATAANNRGFIESYQQSGVANAKEWISTQDDRTRDSHITTDGEIVGLDDEFSNGLSYPGDPAGGAEETINCRCVLAPAFKEQ